MKDFKGEQSPYWNWLKQHEDDAESLRGNPDGLLAEGDEYAERRAQLTEFVAVLYKRLSKKEREVLGLLQQSFTPTQIALKMNIKRQAVETYRIRIQKKVQKLVCGSPGDPPYNVGVLVLGDKLRF